MLQLSVELQAALDTTTTSESTAAIVNNAHLLDYLGEDELAQSYGEALLRSSAAVLVGAAYEPRLSSSLQQLRLAKQLPVEGKGHVLALTGRLACYDMLGRLLWVSPDSNGRTRAQLQLELRHLPNSVLYVSGLNAKGEPTTMTLTHVR